MSKISRAKKENDGKAKWIILIILLGCIICILSFFIVRNIINKSAESNTTAETVAGANFELSELYGVWRYDEQSTFTFSEGGKGDFDFGDACLPFAYTLDGDYIKIVFDNGAAQDISYKAKMFTGTDEATGKFEKSLTVVVINENGEQSGNSYKWIKE